MTLWMFLKCVPVRVCVCVYEAAGAMTQSHSFLGFGPRKRSVMQTTMHTQL